MFTIAFGYSYNGTLSIPLDDIAYFINDVSLIYNIKLEQMGIKIIHVRR